MSSSKPRAPSISDRLGAFFGGSTTPSTKDSKENQPANKIPPQLQQTPQKSKSPPSSLDDTPVSPNQSTVVVSSPSTSFLGSLKQRASLALQARRDESNEKHSFKSTGAERINGKMITLVVEGETKKERWEALDSYLTTYYDGRYLLLDISNVLSTHDCPDSLFRSTRLSLEFGGSGTLGPLDQAARISAAARRWWAAEEESAASSSSTNGGNLVVLVVDSQVAKVILSTCVLYESMVFESILAAFHHVLLASENRLMASLHLRSMAPSQKKFLNDFSQVQKYDKDFHVPQVWLHELRIHRLPQFEEEGTRLLLIIIANRTQFLYTSQQQGGGHVWIPTTKEDPLTVVVPLAIQFSGEASIKIWHLPEHSSVNNPRQLILETKVHSAVLALPCWRMRERGVCEQTEPTATTRVAPASSSPAESKDDAEANGSTSASTTVASVPQSPPQQPITYPLHRLFLRKDELELNNSDESSHITDPSILMPQDVEYHKNFRMSLTATPMEIVKYRNLPEDEPQVADSTIEPSNGTDGSDGQAVNEVPSTSSAGAAAVPIPIAAPVASTDSVSSLIPSSTSPPTPEVDLLQLAAQWSQSTLPSPATNGTDRQPSPERSDDSLSALPSPSSLSTPPRHPASKSSSYTRTPANSSASDHAPAPASVQETPQRRKRTDSGANGSSSSTSSTGATSSPSPSKPLPPAFIPPPLTVPPEARTTAGIRFYPEDKNGLERAETPEEIARRETLARERHQFDLTYGPGNWRRQHGVLYTLASASDHSQRAHYQFQAQQQQAAQAQMQMMQQQYARQLQHASVASQSLQASGLPMLSQQPPQRSHSQSSSQAEAEIARMHHQSIQRAEQEAQQLAAQRDADAAQVVLDDPESTAEEKDAALARLLAFQFAREDAQQQQQQVEAHRQQQLADMQARQAQLQALQQSQQAATISPISHTLQRVSSGSAGRSGSGRSSSSRSSRHRSSAASGQPMPPSSASSSVTVRADGSIVITGGSSNSSSAAATPNGSAQPTDDEALARAMQRQFDLESSGGQSQSHRSSSSRRNLAASLAAAQGNLNPDTMHYDQRLALEELMGASRSHAAKTGASEDQIHQLPEFRLEISSKYLEEECQICREQFAAGDVVRLLQCMHCYHSLECIDPWLRTNRTCPVCKVPIHQMNI